MSNLNEIRRFLKSINNDKDFHNESCVQTAFGGEVEIRMSVSYEDGWDCRSGSWTILIKDDDINGEEDLDELARNNDFYTVGDFDKEYEQWENKFANLLEEYTGSIYEVESWDAPRFGEEGFDIVFYGGFTVYEER